jgi:hypothetical protein
MEAAVVVVKVVVVMVTLQLVPHHQANKPLSFLRKIIVLFSVASMTSLETTSHPNAR